MPFNSTNNETKDLSHSNQSQSLPIQADKSNFEQLVVPRSLIGKAVFIKGDIAAKEDILINGRLEGTVAIKSNTLEIGVDGHIHANTFAKVIIISGEVIGDVYASDQVIVTKTGNITGDIFTADLSIEDGAYIKGKIDTQKQDIFKQDTLAAAQDESHSKASSFGFLFKKGREASQTDTASIEDMQGSINVSDDIIPFSVDNHVGASGACSDCSVIGESVFIKGELISEEDVVIQGHIEGVIYFKNHTLSVGTHSQIKGNIFVKSLLGFGEIRGDIYASEQVIIKKLGHVYGKIYSPRVSTEKGAVIIGDMEMEPQNIEKIFAGMEESSEVISQTSNADITEKQNEDELNSGSEIGTETGRQQKDKAWPIFYPRS